MVVPALCGRRAPANGAWNRKGRAGGSEKAGRRNRIVALMLGSCCRRRPRGSAVAHRSATIAVVVAAAAVLASCSSTAPKAAPAQTSPTGASSAAGPPLVSFEASAALAANGPLATGQTAASTCGSNRSGWLAEIAKVGLSAAKVSKHWAFLEPLGNGITGRQLQGSGTITSIDVGNVDVPFDHPFAGDMSFNEKLDSPYVGLSRNLGVGLTPGEGDPRGVVHDELMTGLMPHPVGNGSLGATSTWPQYATNSAKTVTQAFVPRTGDRVAVMGYWVVDCGHTDFHTELHSVTFMAYGHRSGSATVAHAFFNPYEEAQLYNPDLALAGLVSDPSRLDAPATQNILKYLVTAIVRVASGQDKQATLPVLVEPNLQSPAPWTVCAPPGTRGGPPLPPVGFLPVLGTPGRGYLRDRGPRDGLRTGHDDAAQGVPARRRSRTAGVPDVVVVAAGERPGLRAGRRWAIVQPRAGGPRPGQARGATARAPPRGPPQPTRPVDVLPAPRRAGPRHACGRPPQRDPVPFPGNALCRVGPCHLELTFPAPAHERLASTGYCGPAPPPLLPPGPRDPPGPRGSPSPPAAPGSRGRCQPAWETLRAS